MYLVARGNESQCARRHFFLAGDSAPRPGIFGKRAKQREARAAHERKFLGEAGKGPFAEPAILNEVVLFESGEWRLVATREAQGPVRKYPLRVRDVSQYFFYRPFSQSIPEASVSLAPSRE